MRRDHHEIQIVNVLNDYSDINESLFTEVDSIQRYEDTIALKSSNSQS